jgi:hypothetical protein
MRPQKTIWTALLACLAAAALLGLSGCSSLGRSDETKTMPAPTQRVVETAPQTPAAAAPARGPGTPAPMPSSIPKAPAGTPNPASGRVSLQSFSSAFQLVSKSPLDTNLQHAMYLESRATAAAPAQTAGSARAAISQLLQKYQGLASGPGLHYTDSALVMGFETQAEHWVKAGKFKKVDRGLNTVTLFNGKEYIEYQLDTKKGKKLSKDDPAAVSAIKMEVNGYLSMVVSSPYVQKEDAKVGKFDCAVFFMDVAMLGMKGNTLSVDKASGMLVQNVYGDPKDKQKSMVTTVLTLDSAGFGDEVFAVPADVKFE